MELFNRIAHRCKEYKPIEAATRTVTTRIQELIGTDPKFKEFSFWEGIFLRGRDYVLWAGRDQDPSPPRTLGWILREGVLEMVLSDARTSWEQTYTTVSGETMRQFREYVLEHGLNWELLKKELQFYVLAAKKTDQGVKFTTCTPSIGRRIVWALERGDFPTALSLFVFREEEVQR